MIDFKPITPEDKERYEKFLFSGVERGCEYSFCNLFVWGEQKIAFVGENALILSRFGSRYIYPFPIGDGDKREALDLIIADAAERKIPCRISGIRPHERQIVEDIYPDKFKFRCVRGSFDYVYDINDLADLKGKKYHGKRNHYNRFKLTYPDYKAEPLSEENLPRVKKMVAEWYKKREESNPDSDFALEKEAIGRALANCSELRLESLVISSGDNVLAVTLASKSASDTFDVHFEKAAPDADGAYAAINCEFASYIRRKYPEVRYLNREEDMGIEGLRKAKESYYPHRLIEKCAATLEE